MASARPSAQERATGGAPCTNLQHLGLRQAWVTHAWRVRFDQVDLDALRELAWGGIPLPLRPQVWRLLCGYVPPARRGLLGTAGCLCRGAHALQGKHANVCGPRRARQAATLERRRREYMDMVS